MMKMYTCHWLVIKQVVGDEYTTAIFDDRQETKWRSMAKQEHMKLVCNFSKNTCEIQTDFVFIFS